MRRIRSLLHRVGIHWWRRSAGVDFSTRLHTCVILDTCRICGLAVIRSAETFDVGEVGR